MSFNKLPLLTVNLLRQFYNVQQVTTNKITQSVVTKHNSS